MVTASRISKKSKSSIRISCSVVRWLGASLLHALNCFCAERKISSTLRLVSSLSFHALLLPSYASASWLRRS